MNTFSSALSGPNPSIERTAPSVLRPLVSAAHVELQGLPMHVRRWLTEDFDAMSWHDCHVHGLRVSEGQDGTGELELDIDYITEGRRDEEGMSFVLVPSMLRFHEVFGLRLALDWLGPSAALGPFSLNGIERTVEQRANYTATLWHLEVNWPAGTIEFEATGFTQQAWGHAVVSRNQVLAGSERVAA